MDGYKLTSVIKSTAGVSVKVESFDPHEPAREFLMSAECWNSLSYSEGDSITEEDADILEGEAMFCRAVARTVKILSYSSHSRAVLVRKLCGYGFTKEVAERAASAAEEKGDLDENRQTEHLVDYYLRHKYWGKKRIVAELMSRGYSKTAILGTLAGVPEERYTENLLYLTEKKPVPTEKSARDKYIAALCRMGYSLSEILKVINDR